MIIFLQFCSTPNPCGGSAWTTYWHALIAAIRVFLEGWIAAQAQTSKEHSGLNAITVQMAEPAFAHKVIVR